LEEFVYQAKVRQLLAHYRASGTRPKPYTRVRMPELRAVFDQEFGPLPF